MEKEDLELFNMEKYNLTVEADENYYLDYYSRE